MPHFCPIFALIPTAAQQLWRLDLKFEANSWEHWCGNASFPVQELGSVVCYHNISWQGIGSTQGSVSVRECIVSNARPIEPENNRPQRLNGASLDTGPCDCPGRKPYAGASGVTLNPRARDARFGLEAVNRGGLFQRQTDVIKPLEQTVFFERIHLE